jgi:L-seryl-tRNA(Ser) seleniumtransferase
MKQYLRLLPPVHELQKEPLFSKMCTDYQLSEKKLTELLQIEISRIRGLLLEGEWTDSEPTEAQFISTIFERVKIAAQHLSTLYLQRLINGTGTILHTNLGRARLSHKAIEHVVKVAQSYSNLEYNIEAGKRGSRHDIIEGLIKEVTGAEAAMVVNNNAAAVYLILRALANGKEVIVSRGQLVEIGGSFRVSAIMEESGAILKEVGTTNKTHLYDYKQAIHEETGMVMKVHTSNFKTIGFTQTVNSDELVSLAKDKNVIFYEDLGSGVLYDFRKHGIGDEPVVKEILEMGADVVSFSGDKLLGGPQAGIIAGKKEIIQQLKKHQLARVLRVDKMTFAALEATLHAYLTEGGAVKEIPTVRDLLEPMEKIEEKALRFVNELKVSSENYVLTVSRSTSQVGGGTMPDVVLPTFVAEVQHTIESAEKLSMKLRQGEPGIVTRLKEERVLIDFRTISEEEIRPLVEAFATLD